MKKISIAICCGMAFISSCCEKGPAINLNPPGDDTTYVLAAAPAAKPHNVLVEEFTGESCSNCPAAHDQLNGIEDGNPGRVNVIGLYIYGIVQTTPPDGAAYDLRTQTATDIANMSVYNGVTQIPAGGIDRLSLGGTAKTDPSIWNSTITSRLAIADSVNVDVTSSFNNTTGVATINASVTYLYNVTTKQNLSVVLVEDSIKDFQEYPLFGAVFPNGMDSNYVFTNVFRDMISSVAPTGDPILDTMAAKQPGRVYRRTYTYTPPVRTPAIKPEHCRVIVFVNSTADNSIWQSAQTKLIN